MASELIGSELDAETAEKRCIQLVANHGEKLKFALIKVGLNYKSNSKEYHRLRRKICQIKDKKEQRIGNACLFT